MTSRHLLCRCRSWEWFIMAFGPNRRVVATCHRMGVSCIFQAGVVGRMSRGVSVAWPRGYPGAAGPLDHEDPPLATPAGLYDLWPSRVCGRHAYVPRELELRAAAHHAWHLAPSR